MGDKRLAKKVDKFESKAETMREKAADKAALLSERAGAKADELQAQANGYRHKRRGKKRFLALVLAAAGGTALFMKKKRDQELDEALWEEPREV